MATTVGEMDCGGESSLARQGSRSQKRVRFDMERDPGERDAHVGDRAVRWEVAQLHLRLVQNRAEGAAVHDVGGAGAAGGVGGAGVVQV